MKETDPAAAKIQTNQDTRTVPDPSVLTTQLVLREVASAREIIDTRMKCIEEEVARQNVILNKRNEVVETGVANLRHVLLEKFKTVKLQFKLIEQQRTEQKSDTKAAVDAALTAQKEAVKEQTAASEKSIAKSEAATKERIDLQAKDLRTSGDSTNQQVGDLKERVTLLEGRKEGISAFVGWMFGAAAIVMAIIFHFVK